MISTLMVEIQYIQWLMFHSICLVGVFCLLFSPILNIEHFDSHCAQQRALAFNEREEEVYEVQSPEFT